LRQPDLISSKTWFTSTNEAGSTRAWSQLRVEKNWLGLINKGEFIMFHFMKKNAKVEEQVLEEVTDEQLDQVTGGVTSLGAIEGTVANAVDSVSVSGFGVQAAGAGAYTPAVSTNGLL
jgi:hypothetical protein